MHFSAHLFLFMYLSIHSFINSYFTCSLLKIIIIIIIIIYKYNIYEESLITEVIFIRVLIKGNMTNRKLKNYVIIE